MATYLIKFKPIDPWFFGNEKSFAFPGSTAESGYRVSYFARSETLPSQSAILGTLRYLMLPHKKAWKDYSEDEIKQNNDAVGKESFDIDYKPTESEPTQEFGCIKKISPVFIMKNDEILIPLPLVHNAKKSDDTSDKAENKKESESDNEKKKSIKTFKPFTDYHSINSCGGKKLYALDYEAKAGLIEGFVSLSKNSAGEHEIYPISDIIGSEERIGVNLKQRKNGFFKKEYKYFKSSDYTFAEYAEIDDNKEKIESAIATMGQGKSTFAVEAVKTDNTIESFESNVVKNFLKESLPAICIDGKSYTYYYCLSDTFVSGNPYESTAFAATMTKDYRAFKTISVDKDGKRGVVTKGAALHRMLKAGSVIITEKGKEFTAENANTEQIGFNCIINTEE